ncbi:MAG: Rho termination factor N-terminal domain-containing protein, partial [Phycisphaerales bacterium]
MPSKKSRRRRKRSGSSATAVLTPMLQPGEVPTDEELEAEAAALEEEAQGKYDLTKKDDLSLAALQHMALEELHKIAKRHRIPDFATLKKQKLVFEILKARARKHGLMIGEGTLEVLPDGYGFLRSPEYSYLASPDDVYVSPSQIRKFGLRKGQIIKGLIRPPK